MMNKRHSMLFAALLLTGTLAGFFSARAENLLTDFMVVTNFNQAEFFTAMDNELAASPIGSDLDELWAWMERTFYKNRQYDVEFVVVQYVTRTATGEAIPVSGLCIVPTTSAGLVNTSSVPIMSMQHPTQVERRYSPSICGLLDPQLTVPIAALIAGSGYIVVLADYPGLGVNTNVHPYCHISLANSVVDMIRASLEYTGNSTNAAYPGWDGRIYMMGYSEGGYATMVAAKSLQLDPLPGLIACAVAPLNGPHSLSGTMLNVILQSGTNYASPYFLPYFLNGYDAAYASEYPDFFFTNAVKTSVPSDPAFSKNLLQMVMSGTNTSKEMMSKMMEAVPYQGPRSIMTDSFINELANPESLVSGLIAANDSYRAWAPQMAVRLMHNYDDDLVPYDNSLNAALAFTAAGAPLVTLDTYYSATYPLIYLLQSAMGSVHSASCPFAWYRGYCWLDSLAYPDRKKAMINFFDYDADLVCDLTVYWPAAGNWYIMQTALPIMSLEQWGWCETVPVPGDYDGDGKSDLAVYWPSTGAWYVRLSSTGAQWNPIWGGSGLIPVPADYDGDGKTDVAVYWPEFGTWHVLLSSDGTRQDRHWGWAQSMPVPGDYDGDGKCDPAVYAPDLETWYILESSTGLPRVKNFGFAQSMPIPADYDYDGKTDLAFYWQPEGIWYVLYSSTGSILGQPWGWAETMPVPADYDGDGKTDFAVYWPEGGMWYILHSATLNMRAVSWGMRDALPVDNQSRINRIWFSEER